MASNIDINQDGKNTTYITGGKFGIELPAIKSVIEENNADLSKNSSQFRNLDANFFVDNGYLRFVNDNACYAGNCNADLSTFTNDMLNSIRTNLFSDPESQIEILPLHDDEFNKLVNSCEYETHFDINIPLVIGLCNSDSEMLTVRPGQHHIVDAMSCCIDDNRLDTLRNSLDSINPCTIRFNCNEFVYILPNLMRSMTMPKHMTWFKVVDNRPACIPNHNFDTFDQMNKEFSLMYVHSLNNQNIPLEWMDNNQLLDIISQFTELAEKGWGQLMNVSEEYLTFRIRSIASDDILIMGDPSLYEAVYEVLYYYDMSKRAQHSNYSLIDRFEVRTSGFIARRRNDLLTADLYKLCTNGSNDESDFSFDLMKVSSYLRNLNFNQIIKKWFPIEKKEELSGLCLTDIKSYSTYVFRYRALDSKNITRMVMVEDWIKELDIKGGFVLSDPDVNRSDPRHFGYLIVSGESIVYGHIGKSGDLNTFMDRYDSFHWKKVTRYSHRNCDFLFEVDYKSYPDSFFIITHDELHNKEEYTSIRDIVKNIK
jgi:hypothetical protein